MTKKKTKQRSKEERDEGETLLSFRRAGWWVHLAWVAASAVWRHTPGTNGGFMILYQLSAVSQHLTASYKKWHHHKRPSRVTDEQ